mgnify:CR=1 FL=1
MVYISIQYLKEHEKDAKKEGNYKKLLVTVNGEPVGKNLIIDDMVRHFFARRFSILHMIRSNYIMLEVIIKI